MKKVAIVFLGLLAVSLWVFAAAPPDVKKFAGGPQGEVTFPHGVHAKAIKCVECHHTTKEGENPQPCSACHDAKEAKDKAPKLKDAIHKSCWDCHKTTKAAGKKSGPEMKDCKVCHVKA